MTATITEIIPRNRPDWFNKAMENGNVFTETIERDKMLIAIWEAATDYRMVEDNEEFAEGLGSLEFLKCKLDKAIANWEESDD